MKKISYVLMLLAISILVCGCPADDTGHRAVVFVNRSGKTIGFQNSFGKVSQIAEDTLFKCNKTSDRIIDNDSSLVIEAPIRSHSWEVGSYSICLSVDINRIGKDELGNYIYRRA